MVRTKLLDGRVSKFEVCPTHILIEKKNPKIVNKKNNFLSIWVFLLVNSHIIIDLLEIFLDIIESESKK